MATDHTRVYGPLPGPSSSTTDSNAPYGDSMSSASSGVLKIACKQTTSIEIKNDRKTFHQTLVTARAKAVTASNEITSNRWPISKSKTTKGSSLTRKIQATMITRKEIKVIGRVIRVSMKISNEMRR